MPTTPSIGVKEYGNGFVAVLRPLAQPARFTPHTHSVTLWHDGIIVNWDVCTETKWHDVADLMYAESI
jgi:hypothetical protein